MTDSRIWTAILVAAGVSLVVRALPLTLIRRPIKSRFIRSFLFYVPYVTAGAGAGLFPVAVITCVTEYLAGLI